MKKVATKKKVGAKRKGFDLSRFDLALYEEILKRGLSAGQGVRGRQVCIEVAVAEALGIGVHRRAEVRYCGP